MRCTWPKPVACAVFGTAWAGSLRKSDTQAVAACLLRHLRHNCSKVRPQFTFRGLGAPISSLRMKAIKSHESRSVQLVQLLRQSPRYCTLQYMTHRRNLTYVISYRNLRPEPPPNLKMNNEIEMTRFLHKLIRMETPRDRSDITGTRATRDLGATFGKDLAPSGW
jgi:hypothetical protein